MKTRTNARLRSYGQVQAAAAGSTGGPDGVANLLFNGLTSEKTFVEDPSPVSEALEALCLEFDMAEAATRFQEARRYLDRLCQELYFKLHINNYRINYDAPVMASTAEDLVWDDEEIYEILLPLRLPQGYPLKIHPEGGPGTIGIKIPVVKHKPQQAVLEKDPFDFLKSAKRYVSSSVALKSTWKLVNNAVQQISVRYGQDLTVQQVEMNKEVGAIDITLTVTSRYLDTTLAPPPQPGKSASSASDEDQQPVSFAVQLDESAPGEDVDDDTEREDEEETIEDQTNQAMSSPLDPGVPATVLYIPSRRGRGKAPEITSRVMHLRLTPVIKHPNDEHAFLTPRPYSFVNSPLSPDLWTVQYSMEEALLLQSLARADRGLRLRAWRGLTQFCREQSELRCISRDMLKHAMFHLAETEIDLVGTRWQRANLLHYTSDLLASVRDHMQAGSLAHFFYKDVDLLQCLQPHQRRSAALKIDFFLRKDTALIRALRRTVANLGLDGKNTDDKAR